jgi:hypothetical protein
MCAHLGVDKPESPCTKVSYSSSRLMMAEMYDSVEKTVGYRGNHQRAVADFPFDFYLMTNIRRESSAHDIKNTIELWMRNLPEAKWAKWVVSCSTCTVQNTRDPVYSTGTRLNE